MDAEPLQAALDFGALSEVICDAEKYESRIAAVAHSTASALHDAGALPRKTMREFDEMCLTPVKN